MTAADELLALVNTILAKLPEGANPWAAIRAAFTAQVRPDLGHSFLSQLYTTSAIIALSLCVSHVLHLDSAGRPSRSFVAQAPFLNTFGLLTILASSTSIGILGGASHLKYRSAMSNYKQIDTALSALQITYNGRFDVSAFQSGTGFAIAEKFIQDLSSFGTYFRWTFISYLIWTILLEILLVGAGVLHLRELRRTMDELSNRTRVSPEARAQERMIEQTYNSLVYITYGVCILLTAVNAIFAFVSAAGTKVVYIRSYAEAAGLLPPWIFATLGLPLSLLFFRRTYLASKSKQSSPSTSAEDKVVSPVQPPTNHDVDLALTSVISTSQKPQVGAESYPMSTLAYAQDTPPISPTSPGSTVESSTGRLGGSRGPGSIDTSDSSSRLYGTDITTRNEAPFYSSYATRQPNDVEEIQTENIRGGTASRSSKGFNWR